MMEITSTGLAKILGETPSKIKRHVRELFGHDKIAGQGAGYARRLTTDESFRVYLYGFLIDMTKLATPDIKLAIEDLLPWMKTKLLYPVSQKSFEEARRSEISHWTITIHTVDGEGLCYHAKGSLVGSFGSEIVDGREQEVGTTRQVIEEFYSPSVNTELLLGPPDMWDDKVRSCGSINFTNLVFLFLTHMHTAEYPL